MFPDRYVLTYQYALGMFRLKISRQERILDIIPGDPGSGRKSLGNR